MSTTVLYYVNGSMVNHRKRDCPVLVQRCRDRGKFRTNGQTGKLELDIRTVFDSQTNMPMCSECGE